MVEGPPVLAVEVLSPIDVLEDTHDKIDAYLQRKAGYDAMRAGRINVIPGVGTKIMRVMTALSPSRRFTAELSGRFVSRH